MPVSIGSRASRSSPRRTESAFILLKAQETFGGDYLVKQFTAVGLQSGGENGGWTQIADDPHQARGAQGRDRTADTAIFSRMLYQLSYLGAPRA